MFLSSIIALPPEAKRPIGEDVFEDEMLVRSSVFRWATGMLNRNFAQHPFRRKTQEFRKQAGKSQIQKTLRGLALLTTTKLGQHLVVNHSAFNLNLGIEEEFSNVLIRLLIFVSIQLMFHVGSHLLSGIKKASFATRRTILKLPSIARFGVRLVVVEALRNQTPDRCHFRDGLPKIRDEPQTT